MVPSPASRPKRLPSYFTILSILLSIILIWGCGLRQEEQLYSKDEAERKFIRICKDEYSWDVNTKFIGNTLWIYLPYQEDILKFKADTFAQINKCMVNYLKGDSSNQVLYLEYQITPLVKSEENKGYTYAFDEQLSEDFYRLLNVIYRVYFNAEQPPEFYVVAIADIINGVEIIYTIYNQDLKKTYNSALPPEEYSKRILSDIRGNPKIVDDKTGRHLTYQPIDFAEFLTQQIAQRIRLEVVSEDFKLCQAPEEEILKIISFCLRTYEFQGFSQVILKDLSTGVEITKSNWDLEEIKEF